MIGPARRRRRGSDGVPGGDGRWVGFDAGGASGPRSDIASWRQAPAGGAEAPSRTGGNAESRSACRRQWTLGRKRAAGRRIRPRQPTAKRVEPPGQGQGSSDIATRAGDRTRHLSPEDAGRLRTTWGRPCDIMNAAGAALAAVPAADGPSEVRRRGASSAGHPREDPLLLLGEVAVVGRLGVGAHVAAAPASQQLVTERMSQ